MEMVMDGNGRCDDNATARTAMEGATAMQRRWNVTMTTMDGTIATAMVTATATATMMATAMAMATGMATATATVTATVTARVMGMDDTMVTAMEDATAMQQQQRGWMAPWQRDGDDGDGQCDGNGNGHGY